MFGTFLRGVLRLSLPLLVVVTLVEPAQAQMPQTRVTLRSELSQPDRERAQKEHGQRNQRASTLLLEAQQMEANGDVRSAARRYEEAGSLLSSHDRRGVEALAASARAYHAARDRGRAARMSERAGNRALQIGEVYLATVSFQHAALLHGDMGEKIRAQELAWRSCRLSSASSLSEKERTEIRGGFTNCSTELQRLASSVED